MSVCSPDSVEQSVQNVMVGVSAEGKPYCLPSQLDVTGPDVLITFVLNAEGWVFPATEAVVVTDGGDQFPYPAWTINSKQAALLDCNSDEGTFHYKVTVQNANTGVSRSVDPTIRNDQ